MRVGLLEIAIVVLVFILLFGARKIPEVMKGIGVGIREFKSGLRDENKNDKKEDKTEQPKKESRL